MALDSSSPALALALDAARGLAQAGDGLVTVLLRAGTVVAAEHWMVEDVDIAAVVAAARGADTAVLIVVGHPGIAGRAMRAADSLHEQLTNAGVAVGAAVHVPVLEDGAVYADLSVSGSRTGDGIISWASTHLRRRRGRRALGIGADLDQGAGGSSEGQDF